MERKIEETYKLKKSIQLSEILDKIIREKGYYQLALRKDCVDLSGSIDVDGFHRTGTVARIISGINIEKDENIYLQVYNIPSSCTFIKEHTKITKIKPDYKGLLEEFID
jgi:hypothetical protein